MPICSVCKRPFERHGVTGEETCFLHGNPNGSDFERRIHENALRKGK